MDEVITPDVLKEVDNSIIKIVANLKNKYDGYVPPIYIVKTSVGTY